AGHLRLGAHVLTAPNQLSKKKMAAPGAAVIFTGGRGGITERRRRCAFGAGLISARPACPCLREEAHYEQQDSLRRNQPWRSRWYGQDGLAQCGDWASPPD